MSLTQPFTEAQSARPAHIVFVCTGNIFRSLTAHLSAAGKARACGLSHLTFSSAGTRAREDQAVRADVKDRQACWGLDPSGHVPRLLTREIIESADLVVAMSTDHREFIRENFGVTVPLFKEICRDKDEPLYDLNEVVLDYKTNNAAAERFINRTIDYIVGNAENFVRRAPLFLTPPSAAQPVRYLPPSISAL